MNYKKGWIGIGLIIIGSVMFFFTATKEIGALPLGFGLGMVTWGFNKEHK